MKRRTKISLPHGSPLPTPSSTLPSNLLWATTTTKTDNNNNNHQPCHDEEEPKDRRRKQNGKAKYYNCCWNMFLSRKPSTITTRSDSFAKIDSSRRPKLKRSSLWRLPQLAPRLFAILFLCRFSWDLYMIHNASWPQDVLQPQIDAHRRFLEQFRKTPEATKGLQERNLPPGDRLRRPPPFTLTGSFVDGETELLSLENLFDSGIASEMPTWMSNSGQYDWQTRCQASGLNESSKVFISDVIRQPTASMVALFLAKQCHVKQILGSDTLFPNIRMARLRYTQIYRKLIQQIPNFRLILTDHGLSRSTDSNGSKWLLDFKPSHVLISEHASFEQDIDFVMTRQSYQLYQEKHSFAVWNDLFTTIQKQRKDRLTPRIVQIKSAFPSTYDGPHTNADAYFSLLTAAQFTQSFVQVKLPHLTGPGYGLLTIADDPFQTFHDPGSANSTQLLHVDDALAAILEAFRIDQHVNQRIQSIDLGRVGALPVKESKQTTEESLRDRRARAWDDYLRFPFGHGNVSAAPGESILSLSGEVIPQPTAMPCASQCTSEHLYCEPSAFDEVADHSQQLTKDCQFVMYFGNFSDKVQIPAPRQEPTERGLCRVAFVSSTSQLVQDLWRGNGDSNKSPLSTLNGKLMHNHWRLFWPSRKHSDFTIGDASLLRIDPSRLFSSRVKKALYLSSSFESYVRITDQQAMGLFGNTDAPSYKDGARAFQQHRAGTHLNRWIHLPASKARHSVLMAGSAFSEKIGDVTPSMYVRDLPHSKKQVAFYQQMSHWVHTNQGRPQFEVSSTMYKTFPFEWIAPFFLVHNLKMEESRDLRCKWFEEHLSWGNEQSKGHLEEVSLAYVLGRQKTLGLMGLEDNSRMKQDGWMPFLEQTGEVLTDNKGGEVFLHLMQRKEKN